MPRNAEKSKRIKREHYARNREHYIKKAYERTQEVKKEIRQWLGDYLIKNPCVDCGENDIVVLDFDHRDGCGKEFNIGAGISLSISLARIKNEVAKCDVRCANCHKRRTSKQFNWWRANFTPSGCAEGKDLKDAACNIPSSVAKHEITTHRTPRPYRSRFKTEAIE